MSISYKGEALGRWINTVDLYPIAFCVCWVLELLAAFLINSLVDSIAILCCIPLSWTLGSLPTKKLTFGPIDDTLIYLWFGGWSMLWTDALELKTLCCYISAKLLWKSKVMALPPCAVNVLIWYLWYFFDLLCY